MTGMNQWNTGILGMGGGQGRSTENFLHTLPGELAKAGYHTQGVGKMHFFPQRSLLGFHNTVLDESLRKEIRILFRIITSGSIKTRRRLRTLDHGFPSIHG